MRERNDERSSWRKLDFQVIIFQAEPGKGIFLKEKLQWMEENSINAGRMPG